MLSDKIDTSWRLIDITCFAVEMLDEAASYEFDIHD